MELEFIDAVLRGILLKVNSNHGIRSTRTKKVIIWLGDLGGFISNDSEFSNTLNACKILLLFFFSILR